MKDGHIDESLDGKNNKLRLCQVCTKLNIEDWPPSSVSPRIGPGINLGRIETVLEKDFCPFCRLVIGSLFPSASTDASLALGSTYAKKYPSVNCYVDPRIHGFETHLSLQISATGLETRPIRLLNGDVPEYSPPNLDLDYGASQVPKCWETGQIDFQIVRLWLDHCESTHDKPCRSSTTVEMSLILIDVEKKKLIEGNSNYRYVALSYVWGGGQKYETLKETYPSLRDDYALLKLGDQIPRTVRDAMEAVAALQEKYLWVDALCIVQDDLENKGTQISQMNTIYDRAIFTVVALSSVNSNGGLPGVGPRTRVAGVEMVRNLRMSSQPRRLDDLLQESRYETRGWTFQERLLSRRCLYFSEHQVDFVCRETTGRFDCTDSLSHLRDRTLRKKIISPLQIPGEAESFSQQVRHCLDSYNTLVELYTKRNLSHPEDISLAFLGLQAEMRRLWRYEFHCCHPANLFDLALLWIPLSRTMRNSNPISVHGNQDWFAPSWSWTGWTGGVIYDRERVCVSKFLATRAMKSNVASFQVSHPGEAHSLTRTRLISFVAPNTTLPEITVSNMEEGNPRNPAVSDSTGLQSGDAQRIFLPANRLVPHKTHGERFEDFCSQCRQEQTTNTDILRFEAPTTTFGYVPFHQASEESRNGGQIPIPTIPLLDSDGQQCGALYGYDCAPIDVCDIAHYELVSLSHILIKGTESWLDDRPIFDRKAYPCKPCCIHNIMCIRWTQQFAERVAVGQLHSWAWDASRQKVKKISLV